MANELDEMNPVVNEAGRDVNVIEKRIPVKSGAGSVVFEVFLWVCGILPGVIFLIMKVKAKNLFDKREQSQACLSYAERRKVAIEN